MTKTSYILYDEKIDKSELDFIANNFKNFFDLIINKKLKISFLKMGPSKSNLSTANRFINTLKKTDFGKRDYLYTPNMLYAFNANREGVNGAKNISPDLLKVIKKFYSGEIYLSPQYLSQVMNSCDEFIGTIKKDNNYIKEIILFYLFSKKQIDTTDFYDNLEEYFKKSKIKLPTNFSIITTVIELVQDGYILTGWGKYIFPSNVFYNTEALRPTKDRFTDYLKIDFKYKDILKSRFKGITLEEIAEKYGLTRERIRQIQSKYLFIFKDTYEYKLYKNIFEKFNFSKSDFTYLFDEPEETYYFLNVMCQKGTTKLSYNNMVSDVYFRTFKISEEKLSEYIPEENLSIKDLVENFLKNHRDMVFRPETFFAIYNNFVSENNKIISPRSVERSIATSKFAISSQYRKFRFYNLPNKAKYIPDIKEIIKKYPSGNYSTYKIFSENPTLMKDMDIRNSYELHNFIRKNIDSFDDILKLSKSPIFNIRISSKRQFVIDELYKFDGNGKTEFVEYISEHFGLQKNTFRAYLDYNFKDYNFNNRPVHLSSVDDEVVETLKSKLYDDVYLKEKFEKVIKAHTSLTNSIIRELNYRKIGDAYYSKKYSSLTEALNHLIKESDFENKIYENVLSSTSVRSCLHGLQSEMKVFQIENGAYCTLDYMKEIGIDEEQIISFINYVKEVAKNHEFFSIHSIFDELSGNELSEFCFDEVFYDDIINYSNSFNVVKKATANGRANKLRVYSIESKNLDDFVSYELGLLGGKADIDDAINEISSKYNINITDSTVIKHVDYYAENLEVIYNDKSEYYKDIYGG